MPREINLADILNFNQSHVCAQISEPISSFSLQAAFNWLRQKSGFGFYKNTTPQLPQIAKLHGLTSADWNNF